MKSLVLTIAMMLNLWSGSAAELAEAPLPVPTPAPAVLSVCVGTEGHTIDPGYLSDGEDAAVLHHLFEGLMKYAPVRGDKEMNDMALTCGLAESVQVSADGLTYRFTLRRDAMWSDGVPVRAGDFVYAWQRLLQTESYGARQLGDVLASVTAEDDRLLTAVLKRPCPWFLKLCAEVYAAPVRRDLTETYGGDWTREENIAVSGAYTIAEWVHDDRMVLVKNPYYYDSVTVDAIDWQFADSPDRIAADFTADVPDSTATGAVEKSGVYYLYLNANAIRDWRIRAAMLLAIDRASIASQVGDGAAAAEGLVPAGISLTDGTAYRPETAPMLVWLQTKYPSYDLRSYEGRCSLAADLYNQAVAEGTWSHGRTLQYRYNVSEVNETVMRCCCDDWLRVLGLTVTAAPMTAEDYGKLLTTNTFDVAYLSWVADYDDPLCFLQIMERGGANNHSAWGSPQYNGLLEQAAMSGEQRDSLLFAADCALFEAERFAVCPVYWFGEPYFAADGITGIAHSSHSGYWFGNVKRQ
ncbi:MAG: peptide ABC transporter substrate-binding protein [Oscillospiraceae bacterium]|nr:peptide ABC transporter substrate-binding protein [Oscillospiraceae bacterium]